VQAEGRIGLIELAKLIGGQKAMRNTAASVYEASSGPDTMDVSGSMPRILAREIKSAFRGIEYNLKRYKDVRARIYKACVNRAMSVTTKGYIGFAHRNARKGDQVCVHLGGCTPFLLRPAKGRNKFTLLGETYVYGITAGELLNHRTEYVQFRDFEII
jgi:hypothetical protein